jgi:hypothetical protein
MVEDLGGVDSVGSFGSSYAHACSDDGMIVVGISNFYFGKGQFAIPYSLGTIWEGGQAPESTGWISFSGHQSALNAVTADGMMAVGYNRSLTGISEAILWRYEGGIESLSSVLQTDYGIDLNGFKLAVATGISSDGTVIVGYGSYASEYDTPFRIDLKDSASPVEPPSASSRR